jgi:hypothetical protein
VIRFSSSGTLKVEESRGDEDGRWTALPVQEPPGLSRTRRLSDYLKLYEMHLAAHRKWRRWQIRLDALPAPFKLERRFGSR